MIELSRHIESLLLKHDCVIVPGLGGFVTQYVPARRIDDEQLFLPPFRSVGFNPELAINDGLLAQSYMHAYDTTYPESLRLIDDAVSKLKEQLTEKGEFILHGIGTLTIGIDGRYSFHPLEAGVISPELYGLDAFVMPEIAQLKDEQAEEESHPTAKQKIKQLKPIVKRTDKHYTISFNRELVNYAAAVVIALFFYFIWATPVSNRNQSNEHQMAALIGEQLFTPSPKNNAAPASRLAAYGSDAPTQQNKANSFMPHPDLSQQEAPAQHTDNAESFPSQGQYTIVLASAIPQANANELVAKLQLNGLKEAITYKKGKMVRVVYGNFASKAEAQTKLKELHRHTDFSQAWVMEVQ